MKRTKSVLHQIGYSYILNMFNEIEILHISSIFLGHTSWTAATKYTYSYFCQNWLIIYPSVLSRNSSGLFFIKAAWISSWITSTKYTCSFLHQNCLDIFSWSVQRNANAASFIKIARTYIHPRLVQRNANGPSYIKILGINPGSVQQMHMILPSL